MSQDTEAENFARFDAGHRPEFLSVVETWAETPRSAWISHDKTLYVREGDQYGTGVILTTTIPEIVARARSVMRGHSGTLRLREIL